MLNDDAALKVGSEHPLGRAMPSVVPGVPRVDDVEAVVEAELEGGVGGRPARLARPGRIEAGVLVGDITATALEVGIDQVDAELRPEDKTRLVDDRRTAMVRDNVNDGPALATADLGMAVGAMGTDLPIGTADIALMGEDLWHVPQAFSCARRARRTSLRNVFLPLGVVIGRTPLAQFCAFGLLAVVLLQEVAGIALSGNGTRADRTKLQAAGLASPTRLSVEMTGVLP